MKTSIAIIILFFQINGALAQSPEWSVIENDFQYTMTFVSFLSIDGNTLATTNDKVAAFVGDECRGVANLIYVENKDRYYAYLTVFANGEGETVNFKVYDSTNEQVRDITRTLEFKVNEHRGDLFQAYSFANPELSQEAEIVNFKFRDIDEHNVQIEDGIIIIDLKQGIDASSLIAEFQLSTGAKLYLGTIEQKSAVSSMDYSSEIEINVLSEDESILKTWHIKVNMLIDDISYYKKDAVCYAGGAIKVAVSTKNLEVSILKDGVPIDTQIVENGEVIFSNLLAGNYEVRAGGSRKQIAINIKE